MYKRYEMHHIPHVPIVLIDADAGKMWLYDGSEICSEYFGPIQAEERMNDNLLETKMLRIRVPMAHPTMPWPVP